MNSRIRNAGRAIGAPLSYVVGRATRREQWASMAVKMDPLFFRGYFSLNQKRRGSENFERYLQAARFTAASTTDIDKRLSRLIHGSHGQILQDVMCGLLLEEKTNGYFVEIGVGDGIHYSNTFMLERDLNWKGILAEPARMFHDSINKNRRSTLAKFAVTEKTGQVLEFEEDGHFGELSGLTGQRTARGQQDITRYEVYTKTLDDLLEENNAPSVIDYLSIDTEGSELGVLAGLNLSKRRINFVTIEHNFDRFRQKAYSEYFGTKKYQQIRPDLSGFDAWYVHPDIELHGF